MRPVNYYDSTVSHLLENSSRTGKRLARLDWTRRPGHLSWTRMEKLFTVQRSTTPLLEGEAHATKYQALMPFLTLTLTGEPQLTLTLTD